MRRLRQLFAVLFVVSGLTAIPALAAPATPMGVVVGAEKALIGQVTALNGTSIYDGDVLATQPAGALRLRLGDAQMVLGGGTTVVLHKTDAGVSATLLQGVVRFSIIPGSPLEIRTLDAVVVRAKNNQAANGQLGIVSANTFQVGSTKGDLSVSINGDERVVTSSSAYQVNLEEDAQTGGSGGTPRGAGKRKKGVWLLIGAVAAGTGVGLWFAFQSPSAP